MSALREWAATLGPAAKAAVAVNAWGKWKTATQARQALWKHQPCCSVQQCVAFQGSKHAPGSSTTDDSLPAMRTQQGLSCAQSHDLWAAVGPARRVSCTHALIRLIHHHGTLLLLP